MGNRIARFFHIGRQWLTAVPRYRGVVICALSAVAAMIVIGYNGNRGISPPSAPVVQTSDVAPAPDSAKPNESFATRNAAWSLGSARRVAFAERKASDPGAIDPKNRLSENRIRDAEVVEPFAVNSDSQSGKERPLPRAIALDKSLLVGDTGNENAAIRDEDEGKKEANNSAKKPQRGVKSGDRDRGFNPLREIRRAGEKITRAIRRIL